MLHYSSLEHSCRHMSSTTFLLQGMKTQEDDTFPMGEAVSDVWYIVTRITAMHRSMRFALVSLMGSSFLCHLL